MSQLLEDGLDPNLPTKCPPLVAAVHCDELGMAKVLVRAGANLDARDQNLGQRTPLLHAIELGRASLSRFLMEAGADVNARDHAA